MKNSPSNNSTNEKPHRATALTDCRICGAPARCAYYGARACGPCKIFFKRNARQGLEVLKCLFDNHCEINIDSRHACSYCRLAKCFASGMRIDLFRTPYPITDKSKSRAKVITNPIQTTSMALVRTNQLEQFPTLSLLQSDLSVFTTDHWNLLSNLSYCYDQYSGLSIGERYILEQNILPLKLRFKGASIIDLCQKLIDAAQLLYKHNQEFLSLTADDRSILLQNTSKHVICLSSNFIFYQIQLLTSPAYYSIVELIAHSDAVSSIQRVAARINFDMIVIKLLLAILSFSTTSYTVYSNTSPVHLSNIKHVLHIQDKYIELMWRYLLYKYTFERAVRCCSDLIRCLFVINETIVKIDDIQCVTKMIDSFVDQMTQTVLLND